TRASRSHRADGHHQERELSRDRFHPTRTRKQRRLVGRLKDYSKPASAKEKGVPSPTMKWSRTRTSTNSRTDFNRVVIALSAWLGSVTPEGGLWARMTALQLCSIARLRTARGYTLAPSMVPCNIGSNAITRCCESRNTTAKTSSASLASFRHGNSR